MSWIEYGGTVLDALHRELFAHFFQDLSPLKLLGAEDLDDSQEELFVRRVVPGHHVGRAISCRG